MYRRVKEYIEQYHMIQPGMTVAVGLSGGGDSVALLSFLKEYQKEKAFVLTAVHVHHGIRGEEGDRDKAFAETLCREWAIPCQIYFCDVPTLAKEKGIGLEEAGRTVRQEAFRKERIRLGVSKEDFRIALAHNRNDVAETVLHHLARGTGLRGLCALAPVSEQKIRPILCLERWEIDHYLVEQKLSYMTDSTNLTEDYTRNRIRHNILPLLTGQVNPRAAAHIGETAILMWKAEAYLEKQGKKLADSCQAYAEGYLLGAEFFREEEILQQYALLELMERMSGKRKDLSAVHIRQTLDLWEKQTGRRISLPYHMEALRVYEGVRLLVKTKENDEKKGEMEWPLSLEGDTDSPWGRFTAGIFSYKNEKIAENQYTKWFDYDKIKKNLCVRARRPGDFMVIDEAGNQKKLSRIFIDGKIPGGQRDEIPLITAGEEILWIVGGRMNSRYKITGQTRRVLEVHYQGGKEYE